MMSTTKKKWALVAISLSSFVGFIDFTIVNTALPAIQNDLAASMGQLQWVMSITVLAFCLMVTMGRLGDLFGRRLLNYIGVITFGLASLFAGLAKTPDMLILFRGLQGLAVAIIIPCSLALVTHIFPEQHRGKAIGIWTSITSAGLALGPVIGGVLVSTLGWRWIFFINVPIIIISIVISLYTVEESRDKVETISIDYPGAFFLILGLATLIVPIVQGDDWGWFSWPTLTFFAVSVLSFILLVFTENHVKSPFIQFKLFANRMFLSSAVASFAMVFCIWAAFFLMPFYLQNIRHSPSFMVGLLLLPITGLVTLLSPLAGTMADRLGAKTLIAIGLFFWMLSLVLQVFFTSSISLFYVVAAFVSMGIGWGLMVGPLTVAGMSSLPQNYAGIASGALWTIQNIGGAIGLAVGGAVFRDQEKKSIFSGLVTNHLSENVLTYIRSLLAKPQQAKQALSQLTGAEQEKIARLFQHAFMRGYHVAMWLLFAVALAGFLVVLFVMQTKKTAAIPRQD